MEALFNLLYTHPEHMPEMYREQSASEPFIVAGLRLHRWHDRWVLPENLRSIPLGLAIQGFYWTRSARALRIEVEGNA